MKGKARFSYPGEILPFSALMAYNTRGTRCSRCTLWRYNQLACLYQCTAQRTKVYL